MTVIIYMPYIPDVVAHQMMNSKTASELQPYECQIDLSSQPCDAHRHVSMLSLSFMPLPTLSLSVQPCCHPVFNMAQSGVAQADISGCPFLIVAGSKVHCFLCLLIAGNSVSFILA